MKTAAISEIKQELLTLPPKKVLEICLRLAKFKKENKELLHYLLFESENEAGFVDNIKNEINDAFWLLPRTNTYQIKKGLRKILKMIARYSKYTTFKESEVEINLHFCQNLKNSGIQIKTNKSLAKLTGQQIKKTKQLIEQVQEDLRYDYNKQLNEMFSGLFVTM